MANQEESPDFSLNLDGITDFPYFQHRTLPTRDSIRLVRLTSIPLLFGIDEVQKLCTIETFTTQEAPPYIALSYTWGAPLMDDTTVKEYAEEALWIIANAVPEKTCAGVCNIPEFSIVKIGTNLRRLLLYFSDIPPKVIPYIWIDALCINQANLTERSQQVARMVDIYADCALAFIWLGGGSEHGANVSKVWDLHEDLYPALENNYYNGDHKPDRPVAGWTTNNMYARLHLEHKRKDHDWLNYVQFFKERTWFSRAWVFQEVVFAPKILYNCAGLTFDPVYVTGVAQFLKCTGLGHELTRVKDRQIGDQIALPWFQIGHTARIRLQVRNIGSLAFLQKIAATQTTDSATHRIAAYTYWAYMLIDVRSSDASDLRDKVYAIYGVIQKALLPLGLEPDPRIVPDYNRTVRRLYTDTMTVLLEEVPDIQFLSEVEDPSLRCTEGLPSWVPDFSFRRHQSLLLEDIYTQYNAACCGSPRAVAKSVIVTASSTPHLILKGVQVGVISQIHDTLAHQSSLAAFGSSAECQTKTIMAWKELLRHVTNYGHCSRWKPLSHALVAGRKKSHYVKPIRAGHLKAYIIGSMLDQFDTRPSSQPVQQRIQDLDWTLVAQSSDIDRKYVPSRDQMERFIHLYHLGRTIPNVMREVDVAPVNSAIEDSRELSDLIGKYQTDRVLFATTKGLLGLGPKSIRPGDEVWLVQDARMLFTVRPTKYGDHTLLGETYAYRCMNGELMKYAEGKWKDLELR